jgi:predicted amidohydrolase
MQNRRVRIATVQPPAAGNGVSARDVSNRAVGYLEEAASSGADIICLPEYVNCLGVSPADIGPYITTHAHGLRMQIKDIAARFGCHILLPLLLEESGVRYNRTEIVDRTGVTIGRFDKVHIPQTEYAAFQVKASDDWPVFDCDFGRIGVMTCYDGCFVEAARILAIRGAEIIFWPSLQRGYTESELELQTRAHALFNRTVIVRSSYGTDVDQPWQPGTIVGFSCICSAEATILASLGKRTGWTSAVVDLAYPATGPSMFGGPVGDCRTIHFADRRPETYEMLSQSESAFKHQSHFVHVLHQKPDR